MEARLTLVDKLLHTEQLQVYDDITSEQDVGHSKAVYLTKAGAITQDDLSEFGKLLGIAYNLTEGSLPATCYEWWPNTTITRVPEGCYAAIVRSYNVTHESRV